MSRDHDLSYRLNGAEKPGMRERRAYRVLSAHKSICWVLDVARWRWLPLLCVYEANTAKSVADNDHVQRWPQSTPPFIFRVREMRPATNAGRRDSYGVWHPPNQLGSNRVVPSINTGYFFPCDGERLSYINSDQFANATQTFQTQYIPTHFETVSVYYAQGNIYLVDFDATRYAVGSAAPDGADSPTTGWRRMCFTWRANGSSRADIAGPQESLRAWRSDQLWAARLLPDGFRPTVPSSIGPGMDGSLPLLLALLFFRYPVNVQLSAAYREHKWALGTEPSMLRAL
ncbi:MAG: hypothetical protein Q9162_004358 [Coniocarpon cinnabarinum]